MESSSVSGYNCNLSVVGKKGEVKLPPERSGDYGESSSLCSSPGFGSVSFKTDRKKKRRKKYSAELGTLTGQGDKNIPSADQLLIVQCAESSSPLKLKKHSKKFSEYEVPGKVQYVEEEWSSTCGEMECIPASQLNYYDGMHSCDDLVDSSSILSNKKCHEKSKHVVVPPVEYGTEKKMASVDNSLCTESSVSAVESDHRRSKKRKKRSLDAWRENADCFSAEGFDSTVESLYEPDNVKKKSKKKNSSETTGKSESVGNHTSGAVNNTLCSENLDSYHEQSKIEMKRKNKNRLEVSSENENLDYYAGTATNNNNSFDAEGPIATAESDRKPKKRKKKHSLEMNREYENADYCSTDNSVCVESFVSTVEPGYKPNNIKKKSKKSVLKTTDKSESMGDQTSGVAMLCSENSDSYSEPNKVKKKHKNKHRLEVGYQSRNLDYCADAATDSNSLFAENAVSVVKSSNELNEVKKRHKKKHSVGTSREHETLDDLSDAAACNYLSTENLVSTTASDCQSSKAKKQHRKNQTIHEYEVESYYASAATDSTFSENPVDFDYQPGKVKRKCKKKHSTEGSREQELLNVSSTAANNYVPVESPVFTTKSDCQQNKIASKHKKSNHELENMCYYSGTATNNSVCTETSAFELDCGANKVKKQHSKKHSVESQHENPEAADTDFSLEESELCNLHRSSDLPGSGCISHVKRKKKSKRQNESMLDQRGENVLDENHLDEEHVKLSGCPAPISDEFAEKGRNGAVEEDLETVHIPEMENTGNKHNQNTSVQDEHEHSENQSESLLSMSSAVENIRMHTHGFVDQPDKNDGIGNAKEKRNISTSNHLITKNSVLEKQTVVSSGRSVEEPVGILIPDNSVTQSMEHHVNEVGDITGENADERISPVSQDFVCESSEDQPNDDSSDPLECEYVDLDSLDLTDEVLDLELPVLHRNGFQYGKSKDSKKELMAAGVSIRSGRWTKEEDCILRKNWENFIQKCGVKSPMLLLGVNQGNSKQLQKFIRAKHMYVRLGKGLNDRTLYSIYLRARTLFGPRKSNAFTEDELQTLKKLFLMHGNRWSKISSIMNRPSSSCREALRYHMKDLKRGKWTEDEDKALTEALMEEVGQDFESKTRPLPWDKIAAGVSSRNYAQCRIHWLGKLLKDRKRKRRWSRADDACLIYWMHTNLAEGQKEVDWEALCDKFRECSASYMTLQWKWLRLKRKVPFFDRKDHEYIVSYLYENYLPALLKLLRWNMKILEHVAEAKEVTSD